MTKILAHTTVMSPSSGELASKKMASKGSKQPAVRVSGQLFHFHPTPS